MTVIQNARTSGGGNVNLVPTQAATVGPFETWKAEKVSIWQAGNHDNPFGQRLTIERGRLIFDGPIDNPALDIVALRKNLQVEAGVKVTGTARVPRVELTSEPPVPDGEKLSWLVLGQGLAKRFFPGESALGKLIPIEQELFRVIGVVGGIGLGDRTDCGFVPFGVSFAFGDSDDFHHHGFGHDGFGHDGFGHGNQFGHRCLCHL